MKDFLKCLSLTIIVAFIFSCGGSSSSSTDLTTDQVNSISAAIVGAMNAAGGGSYGASSINVDNESPIAQISSNTYAETCSGTKDEFAATANGTYNCPTDGHVTYTGNLKTSCTAWEYYSKPVVACDCTGDWVTANSMTFQYGDRTNNLYDCNSGGVILDGTIYVNATGTGVDINISITGTLSVNKRGDAGGLVPITSDCSIFMYYTGSTAKWTGTICGYPVS